MPNVGGVSGKISPELCDSLHDMTGGRVGGSPPSASDWHEGRVPGFERMRTEAGQTPMPGDVASNGTHVGIVTGEGKTTSVTTDRNNPKTYGRVVENGWGFRLDNQGTMRFWRKKQ